MSYGGSFRIIISFALFMGFLMAASDFSCNIFRFLTSGSEQDYFQTAPLHFIFNKHTILTFLWNLSKLKTIPVASSLYALFLAIYRGKLGWFTWQVQNTVQNWLVNFESWSYSKVILLSSCLVYILWISVARALVCTWSLYSIILLTENAQFRGLLALVLGTPSQGIQNQLEFWVLKRV